MVRRRRVGTVLVAALAVVVVAGTTYSVSLTPAAGGGLHVTTWQKRSQGFVRLDHPSGRWTP